MVDWILLTAKLSVLSFDSDDSCEGIVPVRPTFVIVISVRVDIWPIEVGIVPELKVHSFVVPTEILITSCPFEHVIPHQGEFVLQALFPPPSPGHQLVSFFVDIVGTKSLQRMSPAVRRDCPLGGPETPILASGRSTARRSRLLQGQEGAILPAGPCWARAESTRVPCGQDQLELRLPRVPCCWKTSEPARHAFTQLRLPGNQLAGRGAARDLELIRSATVKLGRGAVAGGRFSSLGMDVEVSRIVLSLRHQLSLVEETDGVEPTVPVPAHELETLFRCCRDDRHGVSCARVFVSCSGLDLLKSLMVQSSLAAACLRLARVLTESHTDIAHCVFASSDLLEQATMVCQRSTSRSLHDEFVALFCSLTLFPAACRRMGDDNVRLTVPDALLKLLSTQCRICKATALRCLATTTLDSASSRNLFLGSLSSSSSYPSFPQQQQQQQHWTAALLPQLFRMAADKASAEMQFSAAEALVLLAPLAGNALPIARFVATLFALEVTDAGHDFLTTSLGRWRVRGGGGKRDRDRDQGSAALDSQRSFHEHVSVAKYCVLRVVEEVMMVSGTVGEAEAESGGGSVLLSALRGAGVHRAMLLFVLAIVPAAARESTLAQLSPLETSEALREAGEARLAVCATLQRWMAIDDVLCLELYETLAMHKLPAVEQPEGGGLSILESIDHPDFSTSLASQALCSKIRIELPMADNLAWLSKDCLQRACDEDSKGHLPLLKMADVQRQRRQPGDETLALDRALAIHLKLQMHPARSISRVAPHAGHGSGGGGRGRGRGARDKKNNSVEPRLGYPQLAVLFDTSQQETATVVSEAKLQTVLEQLGNLSLSTAAKSHASKKSEGEVRDRPWLIKKKVLTWEERKKREADLLVQEQLQQRKMQHQQLLLEQQQQQQKEQEQEQEHPGLRLPSPPRETPAPSGRGRGFPRAGAFLRYTPVVPVRREKDESTPNFGGISLELLQQLAESKTFITEQQQRAR